MCIKKYLAFILQYLNYISSMIYKINVILIFFLSITKYVVAETLIIKNNYHIGSIEERCQKALDFYITRPDLETEFYRRLEYCINTVKDPSPNGYVTNPIISDFFSKFGVNGRTRMQVHQGVDIIGYANEPILAMADGIVLETAEAECVGPNVVIDHGLSIDNKKLITIYSHTGEYLVKEGDKVKRGSIIAKLPEKIEHPCMARVRHLHVQIGQKYCEKEDKGKWGCQFFIKDLYSSLNPNNFWSDKSGKVRCFEKNKIYQNGILTYPFKCNKR